MKHHFRNEAQEQAFDEWWNGYMKEHFADRAQEVEKNETAFWIVGIAFSAGIRAMADKVQGALKLETTSQISPTKKP